MSLKRLAALVVAVLLGTAASVHWYLQADQLAPTTSEQAVPVPSRKHIPLPMRAEPARSGDAPRGLAGRGPSRARGFPDPGGAAADAPASGPAVRAPARPDGTPLQASPF